jgi:FAD/FMN-containing dehydrogenase
MRCVSTRTVASTRGLRLGTGAQVRFGYAGPPPRNEKYAKVTAGAIADLSKLVKEPKRSVLTTEDQVRPYNVDWMGLFKGSGTVVLRPTSTEEVSALLAYCHQHQIAVVPQGGNTGLTGGSVPVYDEVVLSMQLMTDRSEIDPTSMVFDCSAGQKLQVLQEKSRENGFLFPVDLAAKGSCHIGGNIATNAGGLQVIRYGSTRANVLGLEGVLADGTVLSTESKLYKDNTGPDLKQLLIGSEGILGVVTHAQIRLLPLPKSEHVALLLLRGGMKQVDQVFATVKQHLHEILSAFEVVDAETLRVTGLLDRAPFRAEVSEADLQSNDTFLIVLQTHGSESNHDEEKLMKVMEQVEQLVAGSSQCLSSVATSLATIQKFWSIREESPTKLAQMGRIYKFDLSAPIARFYDLVAVARRIADEELGPKGKRHEVVISGYGHYGDGNVHLNLVDRTRKDHHELLQRISDLTYQQCAALKDSFSAEHGVGIWKLGYMEGKHTEANLTLMRSLKATLDPRGILNPYKVLPKPHH